MYWSIYYALEYETWVVCLGECVKPPDSKCRPFTLILVVSASYLFVCWENYIALEYKTLHNCLGLCVKPFGSKCRQVLLTSGCSSILWFCLLDKLHCPWKQKLIRVSSSECEASQGETQTLVVHWWLCLGSSRLDCWENYIAFDHTALAVCLGQFLKTPGSKWRDV